jgi:molecular chaperone HscB
MNYFELYDLQINFNPDQKLVKQKFYALCKQYHPDFYINESQEKQAEVLELSTLNNKAFQVLKDPQKRLHYILELKGVVVEGENYALPQSFLIEMMDVNEALMELEFDLDILKLTALKGQTLAIEASLDSELKALTLSFDNCNASEQENALNSIKDIYYRNKYLWRINQSIFKLKH